MRSGLRVEEDVVRHSGDYELQISERQPDDAHLLSIRMVIAKVRGWHKAGSVVVAE